MRWSVSRSHAIVREPVSGSIVRNNLRKLAHALWNPASQFQRAVAAVLKDNRRAAAAHDLHSKLWSTNVHTDEPLPVRYEQNGKQA